MNLIKKISIILILLIIYIYVCNISFLPESLILIQGEVLSLKTVYGITINTDEETGILQASSNINKNKVNNAGTLKVSLNLFGQIPLKEMEIDVVSHTKVIPVGKTIGMKLYTEGVLVVGMSEIEGMKPYEGSGIQEGDMIIKINNEVINNTNDLTEIVNNCNGEDLEITYKREEETKTTSIEPVKTSEEEYKLGLWVRDAAAGVGTMTFYEPSSGKFAGLGHGITDIDTSGLIRISDGELVTAEILSIVKGEKGSPGEIQGTIDNSIVLGEITKNTEFGIYGNISNITRIDLNEENEIEVASRSEIKIGKAQIMCQLDNERVQTYDIEIQKLYINNNKDNKSMIIKITDSELLEKTGGIIQGMSGAPIIQNGKFVGSVTHVLVNDPTVGYGVFGDIMIKQLEEVN